MKTLKILFLLLLFMPLAYLAKAQMSSSEPVKMREGYQPPPPTFAKNQHVIFTYAARKTENNEGIIEFTFQLQKGWRLYAIHQKPGCPVKTAITFEPSEKYALLGDIIEPYPIRKKDPILKSDVAYFENTVTFSQKVKLKPGGPTGHGTVTYTIGNGQKNEKPIQQSFAYIIM